MHILTNASVLTSGAIGSEEEFEAGAAVETRGFIITQQRYKLSLWFPIYVR